MAYRATEATRRRAELKRAAFLRAARQLVAQHGFAGAKVAAIARACGTSTGSLYSYFDNRDELLAEVFRAAAGHELDLVRTAVARAEPDPAARLDALVGTFTGRALRGRRQAWSLLFEPVAPAVEVERLAYRRAYVELGESIVRAGIAEGTFVPQHVSTSSSALVGAVSEALVGRLDPAAYDLPVTTSPDEVVAEVRAFCFRALGGRSATDPAPQPS